MTWKKREHDDGEVLSQSWCARAVCDVIEISLPTDDKRQQTKNNFVREATDRQWQPHATSLVPSRSIVHIYLFQPVLGIFAEQAGADWRIESRIAVAVDRSIAR